MNDLDDVSVRILEVARAGAVAVRAGPGVDRDAAAFEKLRPAIHIVRGADDQAEMIERARRACRVDTPLVQREVVDTGAEVHVVGVRLPLDREPQEIDVEALHRVEVAYVQRQVAQSGMRRFGH